MPSSSRDFWDRVHAHLDERRDPTQDQDVATFLGESPHQHAQLLRLVAILDALPAARVRVSSAARCWSTLALAGGVILATTLFADVIRPTATPPALIGRGRVVEFRVEVSVTRSNYHAEVSRERARSRR